MLWFNTLVEGQELMVFVWAKDIDTITSGYDPYEFDGCRSVITLKDKEEIWITNTKAEIDKIMADDRKQDLLYLYQ